MPRRELHNPLLDLCTRGAQVLRPCGNLKGNQCLKIRNGGVTHMVRVRSKEIERKRRSRRAGHEVEKIFW